MKRRISAAVLTLCLLMSLMPSVAFAAPNGTFDDVDGHWGQAAVERWASYGVVNGDGTGNFNPDNQMTRAEFATMLANMLGYKTKATNTFADVNDSDWFADAILKLAAAGVIQGSNGMANPNAPITRQEAAVMMCRAFNIPTTGGNLNFADSADVADWAKGAVAALSSRGMMNGVGNNNVAPLANINRASVATLLDNMITEYVTEDKTISGNVDGIVLVAADATVTVEDATLAENLIVAPKADGAEVVLTGSTTAGDVYVDAAATVKVDSNAAAGDVQVGAANSTVEVAGKADTVTVDSAAADTKVNVGKDATVNTVDVAGANTAVTVDGKVDNVTVAPSATGTDVVANSGATVGKVETSANDVTVSGNGKVENVTANDGTVSVTTPNTNVTNKTDSADNVTNQGKPVPPETGGETPTPPSGGGGGGGGTTPAAKKYNVSIGTATGGKVTSDIAGADEAGQTVTLTVAPETGYVLHELTLTKTDAASTAELATPQFDNETAAGTQTVTFTMDKEGTYTVTPVFVQPMSDVKLAIINTAEAYKALEEYGYDVSADLSTEDLEEHTWLALCFRINDVYESDKLDGGTVTYTLGGKAITGLKKETGSSSGVITHYIIQRTDADQNAAYLHASNATDESVSGTYGATFTYKGVTYNPTIPYARGNVKLVPVTVKDGTSSAGKQFDTVAGKVIKLETPKVSGKYFTGWKVEGGAGQVSNTGEYTVTLAEGATAITITAQFVDIEPQTAITRPVGPAEGADGDFDYDATYKAAGLTFANNTIKVDGAALLAYAAKEGNDLPKLEKQIGGTSYVFYGVQFTKPTVTGTIANLAIANNVDGLNSATVVKLTDGQNISNLQGCDVLNGNPIQYYNVATVRDATLELASTNNNLDTMYFKWMDSNNSVLAVTQVSLKREVTKPATVTFVNGDTQEKVTANADGKVVVPTAPTKDNYEFLGWFAENATTAFDFNSKVTTDITLTAKWKSVATIKVLNKSEIETALTDSWATGLEADNMVITLGNWSNDTAVASGTLKAFQYTAFGGEIAAKNAYYVVLRVDKPDGVTSDKVVVRAGIDKTADAYKLKPTDFTDNNNKSADIVMLVGDADADPANLAKEITIWVNWDGMDGDQCTGTKYTITLPETIFGGIDNSATTLSN